MNPDERGLVPVVVQDELTGEVRMVAWASDEAVRRTRESGRATFYSRSREALWEKGETSGNTIQVSRVLVDCDEDTLLYASRPHGPSCHTGAESCFFREMAGEVLPRGGHPAGAAADPGVAPPRFASAGDAEPVTLLARLERVLEARKGSTGEASYTRSLYDGGADKIGGKLREEADELARAVAGESDERVASEAADVLFHTLVALRHRNVPLREVLAVLSARMGQSGHEEKASREK